VSRPEQARTVYEHPPLTRLGASRLVKVLLEPHPAVVRAQVGADEAALRPLRHDDAVRPVTHHDVRPMDHSVARQAGARCRLEELAQAESATVDEHPALAARVPALDAHPPTTHATDRAHIGVHQGAKQLRAHNLSLWPVAHHH